MTDVLRTNFERVLEETGLYAALAFLNAETAYRLTGVYRFEPGVVKSVALYDRMDLDRRIGSDVPWFDSYCMMTAGDGVQCEIQNSLTDARLRIHAARATVMSYCAVLLRTVHGDPLGTLCHYDVCPRNTAPGTFEGLHACRAAVERWLWFVDRGVRLERDAPISSTAAPADSAPRPPIIAQADERAS